MRIAHLVFTGSIAVLTAVITPALANSSRPNSHADANAKATEEAPASDCHAYQKGADGSWIELACHEGPGNDSAKAPANSKSASHHPANGSTAR